ncbi:MAG: DNA alkylation response protein [Magnetovibrio sp.]|nr:DNA alkylation response protein [Magnetovibrio sp.]
MSDLDKKEHSVDGAAVLAPDTTDWNFYAVDQDLRDILAIYLKPSLLAHLDPHLMELGMMAAGKLDRASHLANQNPPILHVRDRFGRDEEWIEYHPAYRELEAVAYGHFGIHAMSHQSGILGWPHPFPAVAKHAFTYLFNQAEFGLGCPINVTDSGVHALKLFADEDIQERFVPRMTTTNIDKLWQGAQFMTEREGGSDVANISTEAKFEGGDWHLYGEKWFCSNADAAVSLLLARPEGAVGGSRGLGLFIMPRNLDDRRRNRYRIIRLKDKLGTRSMASGEVKLEGAVAYPIGALENGLKQMLEMVNWSRLSNGVKSAALMRRAVHDATAVIHNRIVFGQPLIKKPLARRQFLKIRLPAEQALSLFMFTAEALDRSEGYGGNTPSQEATAILRLATPVLKFRATRDARQVTGDSLEMRGGLGYIEEWINPRLVRDAHLGSIWEGSGNVVAIDAVARAVRRHHCHKPFAAALHARLDEADELPASYLRKLHLFVDKATELMDWAASSGENESHARRAVSTLYHTSTAVLMAWEGARTFALRGDARRVLWSWLVVQHRINSLGPFEIKKDRNEEIISEILLGLNDVNMNDVAELM